jgi:hypothetical protein
MSVLLDESVKLTEVSATLPLLYVTIGERPHNLKAQRPLRSVWLWWIPDYVLTAVSMPFVNLAHTVPPSWGPAWASLVRPFLLTNWPPTRQSGISGLVVL